MEGLYDYNKWISMYEIYWEDKFFIFVVVVFIFFFYLRIKIFDLGKDFWKKCLFVKRLMVWEILNFYKGGGIKGVSGVIFILKNFLCICVFFY